MHDNTHSTRVLALDLRLQRFGYAVLDGRQTLLDWGIKTYRATDINGRVTLARKRIVPLLTLFRPTVIAANHVSGLHALRGPGHHHIVRAIEDEARRHSAELVLFGGQEVRRALGKSPEATKDEIAAHVALRLPELTWKLPPVRQKWMSEHHNIPIFDAASLGLAYLTGFGDGLPTSMPHPEERTPG